MAGEPSFAELEPVIYLISLQPINWNLVEYRLQELVRSIPSLRLDSLYILVKGVYLIMIIDIRLHFHTNVNISVLNNENLWIFLCISNGYLLY